MINAVKLIIGIIKKNKAVAFTTALKHKIRIWKWFHG